jgi:reactive chlorine resistance protein C
MSAATYRITLTFFLSIPGVAEATAGGFPAISAAPGQFLLKDLVLVAASLSLFLASVQGPWLKRSEVMSEQMARTPRPSYRR